MTNYGKNILYHNNGNGTFTDVTAKAGVEAGGWSCSAGFFDYDNDGHLDLLVTRYMIWDTAAQQDLRHIAQDLLSALGVSSVRQPALPESRRWHIRRRQPALPGIASNKGKALGVAFADYDDDGFTDIFVSNDGMASFCFTTTATAPSPSAPWKRARR